MENIMSVNAMFSCDTPTGQTYILEANQALDFSDTMENSLLYTNQARAHGMVVDNVPKFLNYHNTSTHSVYFPQANFQGIQKLYLPMVNLLIEFLGSKLLEN